MGFWCMSKWVKDRLMLKGSDVPWRTIPDALEEADKLLENTNASEVKFINSVKNFIAGLA